MYLVLETFGGLEYSQIVCDEDGNAKVFDNLEDAQLEADDCQEGVVLDFIENKMV